MSKDFRQAAVLVQLVMRATKGRLSLQALLALAAIGLLYVFVLQPVAERSFGLSLPTLTEEASTSLPKSPRAETRSESPPRLPEQIEDFKPSDLSGLLTDLGRSGYRSPAGLRYTRGSQHGHRLSHVMAHTTDEPDRVGQHGVFDDQDPSTVVRLVDEAYEQALSGRGVRTEREDKRTVYTVDFNRKIGYIGGQSGNRRGRPPAEYLRLVVEGDRLITAFPVRP